MEDVKIGGGVENSMFGAPTAHCSSCHSWKKEVINRNFLLFFHLNHPSFSSNFLLQPWRRDPSFFQQIEYSRRIIYLTQQNQSNSHGGIHLVLTDRIIKNKTQSEEVCINPMETLLLEINLISAQGLKPCGSRRMNTYAVASIHNGNKLRTQIDRIGGVNPTWNDKFIFRVSKEFLASDTSAVLVEIYAVGYLRDNLAGTVRFLVGNCVFSGESTGAPVFTAVQIRRPSGRFHGVLNIGAMVIESSDFSAMKQASAIGYRDLTGQGSRHRWRKARSEQSLSGDSLENSCADSAEYSDGGDSTASSSSSSAVSTAMREWNGIRDSVKPETLGVLCGLAIQRRMHFTQSDQNFVCFTGSNQKKI